jgi:hypothetical protein
MRTKHGKYGETSANRADCVWSTGVPRARQIQATDRRLDEAEHRSREAVDAEADALSDVDGSPSRRSARDQRDQEHQKLLDDRSDLMEQLELLDGDT